MKGWEQQPQAFYAAPADDRTWLHTFVSGAILPALQSLLTGLISGLAALILAWLFGSLDAWRWGLGVFAFTTAGLWAVLIMRWLKLTRPVEQILGRDLDGDGYIGEPQVVRIELIQDNGRRGKYIDLPASSEQLDRLARGLASGAEFTEAAWTGANGIFSRTEFAMLRNELLRRGLIAWNSQASRARGVSLTGEGLMVFQALASGKSPTLLDEDRAYAGRT